MKFLLLAAVFFVMMAGVGALIQLSALPGLPLQRIPGGWGMIALCVLLATVMLVGALQERK